jgi:hypothetical protein
MKFVVQQILDLGPSGTRNFGIGKSGIYYSFWIHYTWCTSCLSQEFATTATSGCLSLSQTRWIYQKQFWECLRRPLRNDRAICAIACLKIICSSMEAQGTLLAFAKWVHDEYNTRKHRYLLCFVAENSCLNVWFWMQGDLFSSRIQCFVRIARFQSVHESKLSHAFMWSRNFQENLRHCDPANKDGANSYHSWIWKQVSAFTLTWHLCINSVADGGNCFDSLAIAYSTLVSLIWKWFGLTSTAAWLLGSPSCWTDF